MFAKVNGTELFYTVHGEGRPMLVMHGGWGWTTPCSARGSIRWETGSSSSSTTIAATAGRTDLPASQASITVHGRPTPTL